MIAEPTEIINQRFSALAVGDFVTLYGTYHSQAPFVEQFATLDAYLAFANQALAGMRILKTHIGASRKTDEGIEVICGLYFELDGEAQSIFELTLLLPTEKGWRYHSAQKLTADDYSGDLLALNFDHFDKQATKIRF